MLIVMSSVLLLTDAWPSQMAAMTRRDVKAVSVEEAGDQVGKNQ